MLEWIKDFDPDVLVGHNITNVDLSLLLHRMQHNKALLLLHLSCRQAVVKVEEWSRIGRLKRLKYPQISSGKAGILSAVNGRLLCDTFISGNMFNTEIGAES